ncbi:FAD:protein FMN transferase [uncultured Brachyspira sp.]|uniref:FAD:protein FMN transferase n=1 Tax=uncultured Brachyspira sp. TaxID=221953 RepID=UPI0025E42934|nr:FAD:protein FMN transferase [uncultured Brachyspira sp.]
MKKKKKNIYLLIPIIAVALIISISFYRSRGKYITSSVVISDTILNITAQTSHKNMERLIVSITNEINNMDNILNPYNASSEISIINRESLSGKTEIEISDNMAHIFTSGLKYSKLNPSFDISVRPLIELWGFGVKENQAVPLKTDIDNAAANIDYSAVSIITNNDNKKILKLSKPLTFDFGSYGKGYIIEKLKRVFADYNIKNYLIDYGGDTYANGLNRRGKPWVIAIRNPRDNDEGYLGFLESTNYAIVTSGDYERYFTQDGTNYHHIIDAETGYPAYKSISATIVHTNAEEADALSTTAFLMGTNFFTNEAFKYKEAYIVTSDNELFIVTNENF